MKNLGKEPLTGQLLSTVSKTRTKIKPSGMTALVLVCAPFQNLNTMAGLALALPRLAQNKKVSTRHMCHLSCLPMAYAMPHSLANHQASPSGDPNAFDGASTRTIIFGMVVFFGEGSARLDFSPSIVDRYSTLTELSDVSCHWALNHCCTPFAP